MSSPPTGEVTFLFTDIQGSTRLWERDTKRMQLALARHDQILKGVIEGHGGYVFKMVGDACCAVFRSAPRALEAALGAQRAIFKEPWDERCRIRVRIALHTGKADEREGDYFGPSVNRVARLLASGHGGQTLLSQATCERVCGRLPPGADLKDMGEHRLKDLKEPERIYQLLAPDLPAEFPPLKTLEPPSEDDRYRLIKQIGSGGMAEVYLAYADILEREVAFKVLDRKHTENKEAIERFRREARNAASLSHPNIVSIFDRGHTEDGTYYIVMEYMEGGTLEDVIEQEGPLSPERATEITLQVAKALSVAHKKGVIHRDIKPQNILLNKAGEAKVTDFGIARAATATTMTQAGSVMGTVHYISPEQALGEQATPRSDLYSLGVVLYEMLAGELPYDAETPAGVVTKHVGGLSRSPKEANLQVPEELDAVTTKRLAKDAEDRYPDASTLVEDLERVKEGLPPTAETMRARTRARRAGRLQRRGVLAAVALVLMSVGVIAAVALGQVGVFEERAKTTPDSNSPKDVALAPGRYTTDEFTPAFTFSIGKGWTDYSNEQSDYFAIGASNMWGAMYFLNVQAVVDMSSAEFIPAPSDLSGWFQRHPYLKTSDPTPVTVGGIPGKQFDVVVTEVPKNASAMKNCADCLPVFMPNTKIEIPFYKGTSQKYRVIVLDDVGGETVVIYLETGMPGSFKKFVPRAQGVLDTVEWKDAS